MPDIGESARRKIWLLHEVGEADGLHFIVLEHVTGQSLSDHEVLYFTDIFGDYRSVYDYFVAVLYYSSRKKRWDLHFIIEHLSSPE